MSVDLTLLILESIVQEQWFDEGTEVNRISYEIHQWDILMFSTIVRTTAGWKWTLNFKLIPGANASFEDEFFF